MPAIGARLRVRLISLLVILAACAGALTVATVSPGPAAGSTASTRRWPGLNSGVQTFSMWRDWSDRAELMDRAVAAGTHWLRVDVGWCSLQEDGPDAISAWYESRLDSTVADAGARGLKLLITLSCAPSWSTSDGTVNGYPTHPRQYRRIAHWLATRYRGRVAAWEIWNEPNCVDATCPNGSVEAYLPILRAGYRGIHRADPAADVVSGGVSGADVPWVRRLLRDGGGRWFTALGVHPYLTPASAPPDTPAVPGYTNPYRLTNLPEIHRLLAAHGDADTPIWLTEFGWTTGQTPGSPYQGVSTAVQARYLRSAMRLVQRRYPYVTMAFWYMLRDRDDSDAYENGFGLLTADGRPKPAYFAFRAENAVLSRQG